VSAEPDAPEPDVYVVEHVRQALATDARTMVQGLRVTQHGDCVVVSGTVSSESRRDAVGEVAAEVAAAYRVCNETVVVGPADHHRAEEVS
jgi:osmotically-inducible protein OsmY